MRVNKEIRAKTLRIISEDGTQLGIVSLQEALKIAEERNTDLVEVSPNSNPPVCRLMDFGKYRYEQNKKDRDARKKQKSFELKEVKIRPKIDDHDYQVKSRTVQRILNDGDKVKVIVTFRGREITYSEFGEKLLNNIAEDVKEISLIERKPKLEGKNMIMILSPKDKGGN